jgi:hypothetical protein
MACSLPFLGVWKLFETKGLWTSLFRRAARFCRLEMKKAPFDRRLDMILNGSEYLTS